MKTEGFITSLTGRIRRNPIRYIGLFIVITLCFVAIFAKYLAPYSLSDHYDALQPPSFEHLLGTNNMGQDVLSQVILGTTLSIEIGLMSAAISIGVGVTIGILAGYYRGVLEQILLAITDAFIIIPSLPLMIVLVAYTKPSAVIIVFAISILAWCPMARVVHPRVLALMSSQFVMTSKMLGKTIMKQKVMPVR